MKNFMNNYEELVPYSSSDDDDNSWTPFHLFGTSKGRDKVEKEAEAAKKEKIKIDVFWKLFGLYDLVLRGYIF